MATASNRVVTVFGGTGFLGRSVVRHLRLHGFCVRVASRHPDRGHALLGPNESQLRSIEVDVHDERSVSDALADAYGAVNAISLYGQIRLQPVYVEDVGEAIARIMQGEQTGPTMFECGGPHVYSYEELLRVVASTAGIKAILFPAPLAVWGALARISELLPKPPITRNQVELMQIDSVSTPEIPGLASLGIVPHSVEEILQDILRNR